MVPFRLPNAYSEDHFRNLAYTTAGGYQSHNNGHQSQGHHHHSSPHPQLPNESSHLMLRVQIPSMIQHPNPNTPTGGGGNSGGIPLIGDWLPKMTDCFILSRLYAGVEGQANTWRPAKDISRLLTMSKFMELRERIEKHRGSSKLSSSTKPPLLRYAMLAVQKLCQRNPPLLQVTNLPPNAFNHFLMPPEDRMNNDFSCPGTEAPDSPVLGFNNTKWALTEAGKRWVEERSTLQRNNKRKTTATPHRERAATKQQKTEESKIANFQLLPSDTKLTSTTFFPLPLQPSLSSLPPLAQILREVAADSDPSSVASIQSGSPSSQHQQQHQLQQQNQTQLVMMIHRMQDRLDSMEKLYRNLNDQHLDLQQRHESLKQEHEELRDKFSAAKQITQLQMGLGLLNENPA